MTVYGYARVSSHDQDLSAQEAELMGAGAAKVFKEKVSGAKAERAELAKVIRRLEPGDVLLVVRLDRLARSTRDLLNLLDTISQRGASFRSLRDSWADTSNSHGRLIITVLAGLAEFERELIRTRCGEGMVRATRSAAFALGARPSSRPTSVRRPGLGSRQARAKPTSPAPMPSILRPSADWRHGDWSECGAPIVILVNVSMIGARAGRPLYFFSNFLIFPGVALGVVSTAVRAVQHPYLRAA
jgi:DNA invertase Pin-like site-specific DNA recombinase